MEQKEYRFSYKTYRKEELPTEDQELIQKATEIRETAYMPYSKYAVGAAILLDNGKIITGSNQENAAFPSGTCAERSAIFYAMSQYPDAKILKIAICAGAVENPEDTPATPCGSCRQAILEYESIKKSPIKIYCVSVSGNVLEVPSVNCLLPFSFDAFYEK
ncbi:MAG: cytidine deaminase [Capnocytophaga sp.]|nr:cytidine deaminase [Capnocytophaga sp.]